MNKKILQFSILLFTLLLLGCEEKFNNVIDHPYYNLQAIQVNPINNINYNSADSLITVSITFNSSENIQNVFCEVYAPDNSKSILTLFDDGNLSNGDIIKGDNIYSNKIKLGYFTTSGKYNIKYYVTNLSNTTNLVAVGSFKYSNGQNNVAPVIFDEEIVPDTLVLTGTHLIQVSIHSSDENGLSDIDKVYFVVYRPDGSTNNNFNYLFDDGDFPAHGDQVAGDGIYSLRIQIVYNSSTDPQRGTYRFQFQAKDRGGKLSNIINHFVLIQ